MRLLFVLPEYPPHHGGGIITFYRSILPLMASLGHEVRVIVGSGVVAERNPQPVVIDGVSVEVLDAERYERHFRDFAAFAATPMLRRHLAAAWAIHEQAGRGEGYDLVETTDWGLLFVPWVVDAGPAAVVQLHGSCGQIDGHDPMVGETLQGHLYRTIEHELLSVADAVQTYSKTNAAAWPLRDRDPTIIPPAWAAPAHLQTSVARGTRGLVVGRVQRWKGPEVLCAALRLLGDEAPAIDWVGRDAAFAGEVGSTAAHLQQTYSDVWGHSLRHLPQQPFAETAKLQAAARFVVVPSNWDVFNFTCIEAMGAGTPVVCSTGAGAVEWIEDGINGFVFDKEDAASLTDALRRVGRCTDAELAEIGRKARDTIAQALAPTRIVERRLAAYSDVLRTPRSGAVPAWMRAMVTPTQAPGDGLAYLDHQPLRPLLCYLARRVWKRLRGRR